MLKCMVLINKQGERTNKMTEEINKFIKKKVEEYLKGHDWRVKENSNSSYSFSGLSAHLAGSMTAMYALENIYSKEQADAHRLCDIHIHDLSHAVVGYCIGWSLPNLMKMGFGGVQGKVNAKPAKHLDSLLGQMVNFIGTLQNEWAGAQAFNSFDTLLAPLVKKDKLTFEQVKQGMQEFIYSMNQNSRWGMQAPFSNISLDLIPPPDLKDKPAKIGGVEQDFKYSDCQKEMDMINKAFVAVMEEGDAHGRIFTFPIPTYNLTKEFDWDSEVARDIFKMTAKFGYPYFQNYIGTDLNPESIRSMCCRLQLDMDQIRKKSGGLFGNNDSTGSIGVVSMNLPKIGYLTKTKETFFKRLERNMGLAKESLEIKRKLIKANLESGLMPYTKVYLGSFRNHYSTIGLVGMNECCLNFLGKDITTEEGKAFAIEVLDFMNLKIIEYQAKTGNLYNLEATPAEGTAHRFALHDKRHYKDIIHAGNGDDKVFYTNSTQLPVDYKIDLFDALEHQEALQTRYSSGTVFHTFLGERLTDWRTCRTLVKKIAENSKLPYFSITPTFSICEKCGYLNGEQFTCPKCKGETEVYSRVVGYFRPVHNWNAGKKQEYKERINFGV